MEETDSDSFESADEGELPVPAEESILTDSRSTTRESLKGGDDSIFCTQETKCAEIVASALVETCATNKVTTSSDTPRDFISQVISEYEAPISKCAASVMAADARIGLSVDEDIDNTPAVTDDDVSGSDVTNKEGRGTISKEPQETPENRPDEFNSKWVYDNADEAEPDKSKDFSQLLGKLADPGEKTESGWSWGSWGASIVATASSSVTEFTSQVGQGFNTVLETVESTFGAPTPEELAVEHAELAKVEKTEVDEPEASAEKIDDDHAEAQHSLGIGGILSGVSSITNVIEITGTKVLTTGLNTLELLGKQTMKVLEEGDPGLKKKRSLLGGARPNLSEVIREAKQKAEEEAKTAEEFAEARKASYTALLDDYQGLVHLEALEMLSKQNEVKIPSLLLTMELDERDRLQVKLEEISQACQCEDLESWGEVDPAYNFIALLKSHDETLPLGINIEKLKQTHLKFTDWLNECEQRQEQAAQADAKDIHLHSMQALAELTARALEQLHKATELILLEEHGETSLLAAKLTSFVKTLCCELELLSNRFSQCLNTAADDAEDPDEINPLITSVFLEASNSSTYIQDALQLVVPVLQVALLEQSSKLEE